MTSVPPAVVLDADYSPSHRIWTFVNPVAVLPAGVALLDLWPATVSVSLTRPDSPVAVVIDVADPATSALAERLADMLVGPEAAALLSTHNSSTPFEGSVEWAPALAQQWSLVARLALLSQLEVYVDNGSPWWTLERAAVASFLADTALVPIAEAELEIAAQAILQRPLSVDRGLTAVARLVNGSATLGPSEALETAARLLRASAPSLADELAARAEALEHPVDVEDLHDRLEGDLGLDPVAETSGFLGGAKSARLHPTVADLVLGNPTIGDVEDGIVEVRCSVPDGTSAVRALQHLWVRALAIRADGAPGRVLAMARFSDPSLVGIYTSPPPPYPDDGERTIRARLALPAEAGPTLFEITTAPTLAAVSDGALARGEALRAGVRAASASRRKLDHAGDLITAAAAAHYNADNTKAASEVDMLCLESPPAALGELDY
jgi:hypothetical protein